MMDSVIPLNRIWQHVPRCLSHRCICCYFCSAQLVLSLCSAVFTLTCRQNYRLGLPHWSTRRRQVSSNVQKIRLPYFHSLPLDFPSVVWLLYFICIGPFLSILLASPVTNPPESPDLIVLSTYRELHQPLPDVRLNILTP